MSETKPFGLIISKEGVEIAYENEETYQRLARAFHALGDHDRAKHFEDKYNQLKKELTK